MHPAFLYLPGERLTLPELCAARIDGHVVDLGEGYIPADLVEGPDTRAAALAPLVVRGTAAAGPSAAWIHGAGDAPPSHHHLRRATTRRLRPPPDHRIVFHDVLLAASDVRTLGGVLVSAPERTMLDLVLGIHRDASLRPWAGMLAEALPSLAEETAETVAHLRRVPGTRAAAAFLEGVRRW